MPNNPDLRDEAAAAYRPYDIFTPGENEVPFATAGILLPILMLSIIPAFMLLYFASLLHSRIFFQAAAALTLLLIIAATVVIIISGILGVVEARKYRKLAHPNTHPRPRR